jgi:hypothetical protein
MAEITALKAPGAGAQPHKGSNNFYVMEAEFDFSATNATTADTVQLFDVKAKQLLLGMAVEVVTAEGAAATIDIGLTGGDVDAFIDGANINAAVGTVHKSGDAAVKEVIVAAGGQYFSAADQIDLKPINDLDAAKIKVFAYMIDLS